MSQRVPSRAVPSPAFTADACAAKAPVATNIVLRSSPIPSATPSRMRARTRVEVATLATFEPETATSLRTFANIRASIAGVPAGHDVADLGRGEGARAGRIDALPTLVVIR